jgi:hypothetical protein
MSEPIRTPSDPVWLIPLLACGSVLGLFLWEGHYGLSLWDEGFLWYGVQRVLQGEVPIRDFMAYDPGRYYGAAALMALQGDDGIVSLRIATAVLQAGALAIALWTIAPRMGALPTVLGSARLPRAIFLALSTVTLVLWMFPREKVFDVSVSIALVGILAFLFDAPSRRRSFLTGLVVGLAAVVGRNHGVYGLMGSALVFLHLAIGRRPDLRLGPALASWAAGVVAGYAPILLMLALVPGFAPAFLGDVFALVERGTTNIPIPIPWPWRVEFGTATPLDVLHGVVTGLLFLAVGGFAVVGLVWSLGRAWRRKPLPAAFVASAALALPYAHYAFSRADLVHLAQGVFPLLIGSLALLARQRHAIVWPILAVVVAASLVVMLPVRPPMQCLLSLPCVDRDVAGRTLRIPRSTADNLALLEGLARTHAPEGRSFVVAPVWPGAYAALGRRSPLWEIYPLFPRSETFQRAEIERLEADPPGFALIVDVPLDGREDLLFAHTHALVDRHLRDHLTPVKPLARFPGYRIYVRQEGDE